MPASLSEAEAQRRRRRRRLIAFVTFPAVLIGTAGVGSAAGMGWLDYRKPVCAPTVVTAPARTSFTTNVLNASDKAGAAGPIHKELGTRGFRVGQLGNDSVLRAVAPEGEIRYGRKGLDQALLIQQQLPGARMVEVPDRAGIDVDVVVGSAFKPMAPRPPRPPARPSDFVLNVYNTTYYENLATTTMDAMVSRGFRQGAISADPQKTWVTDVAVIRYGENGDLNAKLVQQHVPGARLVQDSRQDASVDLLLGMKWTGLKPANQVPAPPPAPPVVTPTVSRPCATD